MTAPHQFSKTTHPDVLAAIQHNRDGFEDFRKRAFAFSEAQGVEEGAYYGSSFAGTHAIRSIGGRTKPTTGQWKRGYSGRGWLPFKNNPLYAELESVRFEETPVPGVPGLVYGPYTPSGGQIVTTPHPFIWDGVAYLGFQNQPVDQHGTRDPEPADGGWEEIRASEFYAAMEAYNDALKEKTNV